MQLKYYLLHCQCHYVFQTLSCSKLWRKTREEWFFWGEPEVVRAQPETLSSAIHIFHRHHRRLPRQKVANIKAR